MVLRAVATNHLTKIVFSGASDPSTLDYVGKLTGDEEVRTLSRSSDATGGPRSWSEATTQAELLPSEVLRRVRPGEALLLHGTLPPAHLTTRMWWQDHELRRLSEAQGSATTPAKATAPPLGVQAPPVGLITLDTGAAHGVQPPPAPVAAGSAFPASDPLDDFLELDIGPELLAGVDVLDLLVADASSTDEA